MDAKIRIERALAAALNAVCGKGSPPLLGAAARHAVFPGGARIRPRLCLAVAQACGDDDPALADAAAAAIELLHCASLVHDDLPCFDDARVRRGRPSVHAAFGAPLAVLAGDGLIVLAFETLAAHGGTHPERLGRLLSAVGRAVGMAEGLTAGQAWESEPAPDLAAYQAAKTGALFAAATEAGAAAAGAAAPAWRAVGLSLGAAYQVADDIADAVSTEAALGKPVGQDAVHARPNAVRDRGVGGALALLEALAEQAVAAVPACRHAGALRALIRQEARRLLPASLPQVA